MAEKTTGQWVGAVVGAVIGFVIGDYSGQSAALGASLGGAVGGMLDPPKGPKLFGPRLNDLSQQTTGYGAAIPRVYGSVALLGNVFWIENNALKEVSKTESSGGKGGGGKSSQTTYAYYATFALGLCEGPIAGIRRIWISGKLFYDAGSSDIGTIFASNQAASGFTVYLGDETQRADPRMQATLGVANTPAFRGLAWIMFEDLALADYGNTLVGAQIKVEVMSASGSATLSQLKTAPYTQPHANTSFSGQPVYVGLDKCTVAVPQWENTYPSQSSMVFYDVYPNGVIVQDTAMTCPGTGIPPNQQVSSGKWLYNATQVFSVSNFDGPSGFISESNGLWAGICKLTSPGIYSSLGSPATQIVVALGAGDGAITTDGTYIWVSGSVQTRQFDKSLNLIATGVAGPTGLLRLWWDQESEALYGLVTNATIATIWRWSSDLSTVSNISGTLNVSGYFYYNLAFIVKKNIVLISFGGASGLSKQLSVNYFALNAASNAAVSLGSIVSAEALKSGVLTLTDLDTTSLSDMVGGYRLSAVAALRAGIEPLQAAWPFDVFQSGYKIKFARRGAGTSVATIDSTLLDAREGGSAPGVAITKSREMDSQLPWRVEINHLDFDREYDINTQYAERLNAASINILKIDMAIVMTADDAAKKAEILLYMYWIERHDLAFNLPPAYSYLEPADIVTIVAPSETYTLRLTQINYNPNGVLECLAKFNNAAGYSSSAVGAPNYSTFTSTIAFPGPVIFELLDLPVVASATNTSGFEVAMCAADGTWVGGDLWRSVDNEQTWDLTNAFKSTGMIGFARNSINAPSTFCLMDKSNVIKASFYSGSLSSVTELQLFNGANHFAYGADGRWEIIAAQTCALQADGSYFIYDLIRGRFGSEAFAGSHLTNDRIVLLNASQVQFLATNAASIGAVFEYRGITEGSDVLSASSKAFAYRGVNLKPLCPVYVSGSKNPSTNDWSISWIRRTRVDGDWRDLVDASVGETAEAYELEIMDGPSYSTVKRTITGLTSYSAIYTSAQQTTDFGSVQTQLYVRVYQISSTVGRGYPLARPVPYVPETMILIHGDGTNGAQVFKDEIGGTLTFSGGVTTSTAIAPKIGTASIKFNGSSYVAGAAGLSSVQDFCLEFYYYGHSGDPIFSTGSNSVCWYNGKIWLANTIVVAGIPVPSTTVWNHWAFERIGSALTIYLNGVAVATGTYSGSVNFSSLFWGVHAPSGSVWSFGYLDEVRLTPRAVYGGPFTPQVTAFSIPSGVW